MTEKRLSRLFAAKDISYYSEEAREYLPYSNASKDYGNLTTEKDTRTIFQHDCDCVLYSRTFRRLMHKTQVTYPGIEQNEHTRTRLTHTLEVSEIARAISRTLGLNEDLTEAIALGHDVGHTPFGHEGEDFLDRVLQGKEKEGSKAHSILDKFNISNPDFDFKHNYQSVRMLHSWEGEHYDETKNQYSRGMNVSYTTLEGILKHSRIRYNYGERNGKLYRYSDIITEMGDRLHIDTTYDPHNNHDYAVLSLEGQIVAIADEIAQVCHDLDDAVEADYNVQPILRHALTTFLNDEKNTEIYNVLKDKKFISLNDKRHTNIEEKCQLEHPTIRIEKDHFHEFISWSIGYLILISCQKIRKEMEEYAKGKKSSEIFPLSKALASETETLKSDALFNCLKNLQTTYIINNVRINRENGKADFLLKSIIEAYLNKPKQLPDSVLIRYTSVCRDKSLLKKLSDLRKRDGDTGKNIRYVFDKKNPETELELTQMIREDPDFLRILWDYLASMTDQYAQNEYKMLYLSDPAYRTSI
jgi:dGTPase